MEFIGVLSKGEGTWGQIAGLMKKGEWERVIIIGPKFASEFRSEIPFDFIEYDDEKPLVALKDFLKEKLQDKLGDSFSDVALSIASGTGKEHMAIISAIQAIPRGIRFVALTKEGIIYL